MSNNNTKMDNLSAEELDQEVAEAQARMDALKAEQTKRSKLPPEIRLAADLHRVKCQFHRGLGGTCDYDQAQTGVAIRDSYYDLAEEMLNVADEKTALTIARLAVKPII